MGRTLENIIYPEISYKLTGIFFDVHNELGYYCREVQYCDAVENLLRQGGIKYKREHSVKTESELIRNNSNRVDFLIEDKVVVEVKAIRFVGRDEYNQMQRYLKATNLKLGIIVNFHQRYLIPKIIINSGAKE